MSAWDVMQQLEAWQQRRAVVKVGRAQVTLQPDALVFCPIQMAGWDPSLHAVMIGSPGGGGEFLCAPDPRLQDVQLELYARIHTRLDAWMHDAYADPDENRFPQLIVPSKSAVNVLVGVAYRLAWMQELPSGQPRAWSQQAIALGRLLLHFVQRLEISGQQSLIVASDVLARHFAFGQDMSDHLGALLTWINPPADRDVFDAAIDAEQVPMGARTDAQFDATRLLGPVESFTKRSRNNPSVRSAFKAPVEDALRPVLTSIYQGTQDAIAAFTGLRLPPLPALHQLADREVREFRKHMEHLARDGRFTQRDRPVQAVRNLTMMEDSVEQWQRALLWGDPVLLARGRFTGEVLHGTAVRDNGSFSVRSSQTVLRVRRGDSLFAMSAAPTDHLVLSVTRDGDHTVVTFDGDCPVSDGQPIDMACAPPDWFGLGRSLAKTFRRLATRPITHEIAAGEPPTLPISNDGDPLAAVEDLAR